jgi:xanthine dioxygenase
MPTGLGIESEGLELDYSELPSWEESKTKTLPIVSFLLLAIHERLLIRSFNLQLWKNPVSGELSFQVHPCGAAEIIVDPLPASAKRDGALYPDGAHLKDLKEVRELLYNMQRPGIAPPVRLTAVFISHNVYSQIIVFFKLVYPHDWRERDLVLFHNRGLLHSVVGAFKKDQVRAFHQCNLAASEDPIGPTPEDVAKWA